MKTYVVMKEGAAEAWPELRVQLGLDLEALARYEENEAAGAWSQSVQRYRSTRASAFREAANFIMRRTSAVEYRP